MDNILDCDSEVESPVEPSIAVESVGSQPPTSTVNSVSIGKKRPRYSVWDHFNVKADKNDDGSEVKKPDGSVKYSAVCKICETPLSTGGRGGTSHLRRHAESCVIRTSTEKGQTIIGRTKNGVVYSFKFNQIIARRETVSLLKVNLEKFFENCKSLNMKTKRLPVDIPTRWNSTFIMLRDAIPYQKVIDLFFYGEEYANTPTLADWKNVVAIRDLFKVYQDATKLFSGSRYVTSSAFCYQLSKILLVLKKCDSEPAFKPMYTSMRKKK
ncbi:hypothetical protein IFM89_009024 [Coptis chinensis]|uniref:BED-type domain-containing protein n=1 Tax=Coptis chinensis TaxID=261450 RepID=A0A835LZ02_9MAGN|nr:hypothetical protein IFM89_009024 [Coptis chinensis]